MRAEIREAWAFIGIFQAFGKQGEALPVKISGRHRNNAWRLSCELVCGGNDRPDGFSRWSRSARFEQCSHRTSRDDLGNNGCEAFDGRGRLLELLGRLVLIRFLFSPIIESKMVRFSRALVCDRRGSAWSLLKAEDVNSSCQSRLSMAGERMP